MIFRKHTVQNISRRRFVTGVAAGALMSRYAWAAPDTDKRSFTTSYPAILKGTQFDLSIGYKNVNFTGLNKLATAINDSVPAPILSWREGERVTLRVTNHLSHDTSIHWHGMILPTHMDGVPGLSFGGIKPGETFIYQFDVNQHGTFWYHSHSGFQEQTGMYGAIVIQPKEPDPVSVDRDYVVLLSDWSDESPEDVYSKLKKMSHYYNFRERTGADLWRDIETKGVRKTWSERSMWNQMRMSETDISDVTGYTYTFLMNGNTPENNWLALFNPGEKIRLRFINSAAMTIFDVRIPGLKMKVVAADGQLIDPVSVDEFRIGVAETYDVVVEPDSDTAYTLFAQSIDRTGYARGTLTPNAEVLAEIPEMDEAPILGHADMGMAMGMGMDHSAHSMDKDVTVVTPMDHSLHDMGNMSSEKSAEHDMTLLKSTSAGKTREGLSVRQTKLGKAGFGSNNEILHLPTEFGPHIDMRADAPQSGLNDPGIGLRDHQRRHGRRVLTYADICNYYPTTDTREPEREIQLHLTGNMSRYMWSVNGIKFAEAEPLQLKYGERVRIVLVNDTMMTHPIHLHGVWSELETGDPKYIPRKHTILVQPGSKISYLVTADALGRWAYHCHLLYHMPGMMREVRIS